MQNFSSIVEQKQIIKHDHWIDTVSLVLGYLWLISGLDKVLGALFVPGFANYVKGNLASGVISSVYQPLITNFILPHSTLFAYCIEYSECIVGIALIVGSIWNFFRHRRFLSLILAWANVLSLLLILNIIFALGLSIPTIDITNAFDEGVKLDYIVLLLSLLMAAANFSEKN